MKFNPDLMRNILLDTEETLPGAAIQGFEYPEYSQSEINRMTQILIYEEFIDGNWTGNEQNFPTFFHITDLTYKGHQFLANARNDTLWRKALSSIQSTGKTMSIAVIEAVLVKLATA